MKKTLVLPLILLTLTACGTKRHDMQFTAAEQAIPATAKYRVQPAEDKSGFVFDKGEDSVDLKAAMKDALVAKLKEEGLYAEDLQNAFAIKSTVKNYEPGNAFSRWLMPGMGSTVIEVSSDVTNPAGDAIGTIRTKNSIDAGGGYTIGAWEYIFEHAASEIVAELKESMGLMAEK